MFTRGSASSALRKSVAGRLLGVFLAIEFLDELADGIWGAAIPLIRDDLTLSYVQLGLLNGIPGLISIALEGAMGLLAGDPAWRRRIILGGGIGVALALWLIAGSTSFPVLLIAVIVFYPCGGGFVELAQATLMDLEPHRHEKNMARWALAGSVGSVAGPLALGAVVALGGGWRPLYLTLGGLTLVLVAVLARQMDVAPTPTGGASGPAPVDGERPGTAASEVGPGGDQQSLRARLWDTLELLRRGDVLRWLILLELADLMLDVLQDYLALYFVDVAGETEARAALAVGIWTGAGLLGDVLFVPRVGRVSGLSQLRVSAAITLVVFPVFLLVPGVTIKLGLVAMLGLLRAGWYATLKAQLYSSLPGRSGAVMALGSISILLGSLIQLALGGFAQRFGLQPTMWLLLLGPIAILAGLPRAKRSVVTEHE